MKSLKTLLSKILLYYQFCWYQQKVAIDFSLFKISFKFEAVITKHFKRTPHYSEWNIPPMRNEKKNLISNVGFVFFNFFAAIVFSLLFL